MATERSFRELALPGTVVRTCDYAVGGLESSYWRWKSRLKGDKGRVKAGNTVTLGEDYMVIRKPENTVEIVTDIKAMRLQGGTGRVNTGNMVKSYRHGAR